MGGYSIEFPHLIILPRAKKTCWTVVVWYNYGNKIDEREKRAKNERGIKLQCLNNDRGIVDPRGGHVQCQNLGNTLYILSTDGVPEQFQGQI